MTSLEIAIAIISVISIGLVLRRVKKEISSKDRILKEISNYEAKIQILQEKLDKENKYIRHSSVIKLNDEANTLKNDAKQLRSIVLQKEIESLLKKVDQFVVELPHLVKIKNDNFFEIEKNKILNLFIDGNKNHLLTNEQLEAVICDDNRNLILAGAGSGKTRVIDFKIRYLVDHKNVPPSKILLLTFSKKSASDLVEKISKNISGIEARTIHSFASQIIGRNDKKIWDEGSKEFEAIAIKALVETLKDKAVFRIFNIFYKKFFTELKPMIFYKNLNDLRADLRKLNSKLTVATDIYGEIKAERSLKTLKGEYVRSVDERYIADFLYLHDIKYEYEKKYPHTDKWYYPDFYLSDYDTYLEHFAITESGGPPLYFGDPQKYMNGIQWKRDLHQEKKTRLIESYSYLLNKDDTSGYLSEVLKKAGIEIQDNVASESAFSILSREFCRVFTKFYKSYKLSGLSLDSLKKKYSEQRYSLFLQIFEHFLRHFETLVEKENKLDFNDLLIGATEAYKNNSSQSYDYIIVDEFQDTSNLAMSLLNEVFSKNTEASFLSVGDDWQSIYGFNGSDVTIMSEYAKKYPGVAIQYLNFNFRSHSKIVDLGKKFIAKNPAQIKKDVVSANSKYKESEIDFISLEQMAQRIKSIPDNESVFILYRYNDDCYLLEDTFGDLFIIEKKKKPIRRKSCSKNISMMTIHASKGLEAQHVFVLFPDGVRRKFPSGIEDHFIFNMLKAGKDDYPFSEERRLMYVAITRAEQNLYFVSPNKDPNSVFWDELRELVRHSKT